jgi:hypothetical protein
LQASNIKFEQRKKYRWASQRLIPTGKQSGLLTRIAATGRVSLRERMKN